MRGIDRKECELLLPDRDTDTEQWLPKLRANKGRHDLGAGLAQLRRFSKWCIS